MKSMNSKLINDFRLKVNEHDYVYQMYHNRNGKDQWSIICSAMDWIEVVVEEIDKKKLVRKNDNISSIKMMTVLNCIDVLWEAIQQLHRVFFATPCIPFDKDASVFSHKLFSACDNVYFKTIRACFSAHPVNLQDNFSGNEPKERRYASWSGGGFGEGDFSVILYSNRIGYDPIFLNIYFDELIEFAEKRYKYLQKIMDEIDRQISQYQLNWRQKAILKSNDPAKQLEILMVENMQRLGNEYYASELKKLQIIFSANANEEQNRTVLKRYQKALIPTINELYNNIQTMRICELKYSDALDVEIPNDLRYEFSKLSEAVYGSKNSYPIGLKKIQDRLYGVVNIQECISYEEMYALTLAGFYTLS